MSTNFMTSPKLLFTSESVTEGHPDKMCDQISDAVLDAMLERDPKARVACETAVKTGFVLVMGEVTTTAFVNIDELVRRVVNEIGYDSSDKGFDGDTCGVQVAIASQSPDIAQGVDVALEYRNNGDDDAELNAIGAGDQGMMFGFACTETEQLMPLPIYLAHKLTRRLADVRKGGTLPWLRPDGKSQVTVEYRYGKPARIHTVLVSTQHAPDVDYDTLRQAVIGELIIPVLPAELVDDDLNIYINPTGRFVIGGPMGTQA
jgi:S-adenosylmethionine synthetase